jgi:hypothetical protein
MDIENHMRELLAQYWAELPAKPTNSDVTNAILGGNAKERNEAQFKIEEYYLQFVIKMAEVFHERHSRLPHSMHELLADPVCKKMEDARIKADAETILELCTRAELPPTQQT